MKKIFSILSLFVISISNILSAYTYANTWDDSIEGTEQLNINETESENTEFDDKKVDNITNDEFGTVLDWLTTWVWDSKQQPDIIEEWDETVEQTTTEESKSDSETSETSEISEKSGNATETLLIDKIQDKTTESTVNTSNIKLSNTIDWYECFWTTPEETDVNAVKYECDYTNIIVPDNISQIDQETFAGKNINSITFLNNSTRLQDYAFSWAKIIWDITLPWNQQYSDLALDNLIIDKSWVLTINKPAYSSNFMVYWKVIMDFSQWEDSVNSYNHFHNSYIDWIVIFTWHNWEIWSPFELFKNSELTEKWKIIFDSNITSIKGLFNENNSWELRKCKWEIIFPDNINLSQSFNDVNFDYDWLIINNKFNIINNSFHSNMWVSRAIHWDIIANKISNSFQYTTINWNIIVYKNESNNNDEVLYNSFIWWTISWNVIISWDNMWFWVSNFDNAKIKWDFTFTWKNLNLPAWKWFNSFYISWDLKFYSDNLNVESLFQQSKVDWNLIFVGNENINLGKNVFSSSYVWNDVLISWNNVNIEIFAFWLMWPKWFTVGNDFIITTLNLNSVNSLDNMDISWDIKINWWNLNLKNTFQNNNIWNNLILTWSNFTWDNIFEFLNITWNVDIIWNDLLLTGWSFYKSKIWWDLRLSWNIKLTKHYNTDNWTFENSNISWNVKIHWGNATIENLSLKNSRIWKDLEIKANNIYWWAQWLVDSDISWNVIIEWSSILMENMFIWNEWKKPRIWWNMYISWNLIKTQWMGISNFILDNDLYITWNNLDLNNWFSNIEVWKNLKISAKNLTWQWVAFWAAKINWNTTIEWGNILFTNNWFSAETIIRWNLNVIWDNITSSKWGLSSLKIWWNSIYSWNSINFSQGALNGFETTWSVYFYTNNILFDKDVLKNAIIKKI